MSLVIRPDKGKNIPVLICDECGKPIDDLHRAIVTFPKPWHMDEPIVPVYFFHQGTCDPKGDPRGDLWMPAEDYFFMLQWNGKSGRREVIDEETRQLTLDMKYIDVS